MPVANPQSLAGKLPRAIFVHTPETRATWAVYGEVHEDLDVEEDDDYVRYEIIEH